MRAEPNGFRVHRLNHSATTAVHSRRHTWDGEIQYVGRTHLLSSSCLPGSWVSIEETTIVLNRLDYTNWTMAGI